MTPPPGADGGLLNPIVGSLILTILAVLIGTPIGMLAGTYMAEYGRHDRLTSVVRFINDILLSAPSIVVGLFIYEVMVAPMGHFSGLAGAVALAVIVIPVVVRTTEDMLLLVPNPLREAAAALGLPRAVVIAQVRYRAAKAGMITGVLLAIARISGETAPLLFTALNNQFWSTNLNAPMASLPVVIFQFALSPYKDWQKLAWTGALIITFTVLALSIVARALVRIEKTVMNVASASSRRSQRHAMPDRAPPAWARRFRSENLNFYYGDQQGAQRHQPAALPEQGDGLHRARPAAGNRRCCASSTGCTISTRNQRAEGDVLFDGEDILSPKQDLNLLRARIGMVFQKPTPFPMSIYENIAFGIRLYEKLPKAELDERVETSLRRAALWDEVKDKLDRQRTEPLRRPAAAAVHRAHRRGAAGGDPVRRAMLGARSDLDRQDRGADRRAARTTTRS